MTATNALCNPGVSDRGRGLQQPQHGWETGALDLDRLQAVNSVVAAAATAWGLPERVRRLALPSLLYDAIDLQHMKFLLLDDSEGEVVAVAVWEELGDKWAVQSARDMQLHGLYVLPRCQRQGLGSSLLEFVVLCAGARGLAGVTVRSWRQAEDFFRARGFDTPDGWQASQAYPRLMRRSSQWLQ